MQINYFILSKCSALPLEARLICNMPHDTGYVTISQYHTVRTYTIISAVNCINRAVPHFSSGFGRNLAIFTNPAKIWLQILAGFQILTRFAKGHSVTVLYYILVSFKTLVRCLHCVVLFTANLTPDEISSVPYEQLIFQIRYTFYSARYKQLVRPMVYVNKIIGESNI